MLDIGRIATDGVDYYVRSVAEESAGAGRPAAPGRWIGRGALGLGLEGAVNPAQLRAVLDGRHPRTGSALRSGRRRLPGRDLVLRPPKSVSVLFGLAEGAVATTVADAHGRAAAGALGYLERALVGPLSGTAGAAPHAASHGGGLIAGAFCHATSRADDPLLHTHAVTANLTLRPDGSWAGLDGAVLFAHARAAAAVYQAALRYELTNELGVVWGPVAGGVAEIDGVPSNVVRAFSRRRVAIEALVAARSEHSARAAAIATLRTRSAASGAGVQDLREVWRSRARGLGFGPSELRAVLDRHPHERVLHATGDPNARGSMSLEDVASEATPREPPEPPATQWLRELRDLSSFDRRDAVRALCDHLPAGAPVEVVERLADGVLARPDVTELPARPPVSRDEVFRAPAGHLVAALPTARRYATVEIVGREAAMAARTATGMRSTPVPPGVVETALAALRLTPAELAAVRSLVTGDEPVAVARLADIEAKAVVLDRAAAVWRAGGQRVIAVAPDARSARELEDATGIPTGTARGLLADLRDASLRLGPERVLLLDGAHLLGTPALETVLESAAGSKVVLVTDARLADHDHGGGVRRLILARPVIELAADRDGPDGLGDAAIARISGGGAGRAGHEASCVEVDGFVVGPDARALRERLVADWWANDRNGAFMVANRRAGVAALNRAARAVLVAAGELPAGGTVAGGRTFQVGDRVVAEATDRRAGAHAGMLGTVVRAGSDGITVATADAMVVLPLRYLERRQLDHAYALSAYRARSVAHLPLLSLGRAPEPLMRAAALRGSEPRCYVLAADDLIRPVQAQRILGPEAAVAQRAQALALRRPAWLTAALGDVPERLSHRAVWCDGVRVVAAQRELKAPAGIERIQRELGVPVWRWREQLERHELGRREPGRRELEVDLGR